VAALALAGLGKNQTALMQAPRPKTLICVVGTHTEVGKTWCSAQLLLHARRLGKTIAARKPVQSFDDSHANTDAAELARVTGEPADQICPPHRSFAMGFAPPMAADVLRRPAIHLDELIAEISWPANLDLGVVETAGGLLSPIAHDGDSVDLVRRLAPDRIVLVADAGLGTLNAVRLSVACLAPARAVVLLNRFEPHAELHQLNRKWLIERFALQVTTSIDELFATLRI
jgi:dethiobiotin synthetase